MSFLASFKVIHGYANYHPNLWGANSIRNKSAFKLSVSKKYTQTKMKMNVSASSSSVNSSIWGDYFLLKTSSDQFSVSNDVIVRHEQLKEQVRSMLTNGSPKDSEILEIIDAIVRLGVNYHFRSEIDSILRKIMENSCSKSCLHGDDIHEDNLYLVSLKFRLLRQHGFYISSDVFDKFKDKDGKLKASIIQDTKGMLSLYEATHLRTPGEEFLDEALALTVDNLQKKVMQLSSPLSNQIKHALDQPYHLGIPRLEARRYFEFYEANDSCNDILLSFAKLDFNLLQKQHRIEINEITRWWKELDLAKKLPFIRDRAVESYAWTMGMHFEPEYHLPRIMATKITVILLAFDDTFDVIKSYEEQELLVAAIERWEPSEMDKLPEHMKELFKAIMDVHSEIEETLVNIGKPERIYYSREGMKELARACLIQSKWIQEEYVPTMEEYLPIGGVVTTGVPIMTLASLCGMGDFVTKETFDWFFNHPNLLTHSTLFNRYIDDIIDRNHEHNIDIAPSSIDCYMKQYGCTEEETVEELKKRMMNLWKDVNHEFLQLSSFIPMPVLMAFLNFNRTAEVLFKNEDYLLDNQGFAKQFVSMLLVHPVPI